MLTIHNGLTPSPYQQSSTIITARRSKEVARKCLYEPQPHEFEGSKGLFEESSYQHEAKRVTIQTEVAPQPRKRVKKSPSEKNKEKVEIEDVTHEEYPECNIP